MRSDTNVKTPSVAGSTELVVLAPIAPGFVPSLEAVTYKSRAKTVLQLLHAARRSSHEFQLFRALSDAVERVGVIHTLRVAVLEPEDKILLSVNFDGAYEAYVRVIWQKASRLLDLIFCNSHHYVTGWDHSYDEWRAWLETVKVDTPFFYAPPGITFPDHTYLRMADRFARVKADSELEVTRIATPSAEATAWSVIRDQIDPQTGSGGDAPGTVVGPREGVRQGVQGLAGIYRLADLYPPGTADGVVLQHAACELLPELVRMLQIPADFQTSIDEATQRFRVQLAWLTAAAARALPATRVPPPLPKNKPAFPTGTQAGILEPYAETVEGCACLVAFDSAAQASTFLKRFSPTFQDREPGPDQPRINIAFTTEGLRACGVTDAQLDAWFPIEFRAGMEQRAGVLGDMRTNHPRRWRLPLLNWPAALDEPVVPPAPDAPRVALEAVHAIITLRVVPAPGPTAHQRLVAFLRSSFPDGGDVRPLSVQWLLRKKLHGQVVEHFGFADGQSDPSYEPTKASFYANQVHLGEALIGFANAADPQRGRFDGEALTRGGSYLVVRKLRQDVAAFDAAVDALVDAQGDQRARVAAGGVEVTADLVKARMMGRWPAASPKSGQPLVSFTPGNINDFNYQGDPDGGRCPLGAHIRRANPRDDVGTQAEVQPVPGARAPRLLRRGLSYDDPVTAGAPPDQGLFFMVYNASIGEQFEVVQRWLAGGNSSGGYSGASCPFVGVPESGRERHFRFEHDEGTLRLRLDGSRVLGDDPKPLVQLEWGAYFFAPSQDGLQELAAIAGQADAGEARTPWSAQAGEREIERLRQLEASQGAEAAADAWKSALEDPRQGNDWTAASIWAAIRAKDGVLRIPYGVLVADRDLVDQVLSNADKRYSVDGYQQRLKESIGPIYLGLDEDGSGEYARQSKACNTAIEGLQEEDAYDLAREVTRDALRALVADAMARAAAYGEARWELVVDVRELVDKLLARLCESWFGLSEAGNLLEAGGFRWTWQPGDPPLYPGHFVAPSRYTFQPVPGEQTEAVAVLHGKALVQAIEAFLRANAPGITASVTRAVLDAQPPFPPEQAARTVTGAIMGFVPTMDGSLRRIVGEWMRDGTLWRLRATACADSLASHALGKGSLGVPVMRAMQARPVPELIWRTATRQHLLGRADDSSVSLRAGDQVILALVSATQQGLQARAKPDVMPVFGGVRSPQAGPPLHACPGYKAAMGGMLGFLSALVDAPYALRPGTPPGVLDFEGEVPPGNSSDAPPDDQPPTEVSMNAEIKEPTRAAGQTEHREFASRSDVLTARGVVAPASLGTLLGWGDSWLFNRYPDSREGVGYDLGDTLGDAGYDTRSFRVHSAGGRTLAEMAQVNPNDATPSFYQVLKARLAEHEEQGTPLPRAILVGGGGNDVHLPDVTSKRVPLLDMLHPYATSKPPFIDTEVDKFVDGVLAGRLKTVLDHLTAITKGSIPILVHGYDFPVPDGSRFKPFGPGPWLHPHITDTRKYPVTPDGIAIMRTLIGRLNKMISTQASQYPAALRVVHADLTGTLESQPDYATSLRTYWNNELHASYIGLTALAQKIKALIP